MYTGELKYSGPSIWYWQVCWLGWLCASILLKFWKNFPSPPHFLYSRPRSPSFFPLELLLNCTTHVTADLLSIGPELQGKTLIVSILTFTHFLTNKNSWICVGRVACCKQQEVVRRRERLITPLAMEWIAFWFYTQKWLADLWPYSGWSRRRCNFLFPVCVRGNGYLRCCRRLKVHTKARGPNSANSCPLVYKLCILPGHPPP